MMLRRPLSTHRKLYMSIAPSDIPQDHKPKYFSFITVYGYTCLTFELGVETLDVTNPLCHGFYLTTLSKNDTVTLNFPLYNPVQVYICNYKKYKHKLLHGNPRNPIEHLKEL